MAKATTASKVKVSFEGMEQVGTNVYAHIVGDILTIKVDLKHSAGVSASGKSTICASTNGNIGIGLKHKMGLNIYTPIAK